MPVDPEQYAMWASDYHQQAMRDRRSAGFRAFFGLITFGIVLLTAWFNIDDGNKTSAVRWILTALIVALYILYVVLMMIIENQNTFDRDYKYKPLNIWLENRFYPQLPGLRTPARPHTPLPWLMQCWGASWHLIASAIVDIAILVLIWTV